MKKLLDVNKPIQTRDGRKARIICTDKKGSDYPIVALYERAGIELARVYTVYGNLLDGCINDIDIINIKETKSLWVNIYAKNSYSCKTKDEADRYADHQNRIACVKVEYEEGEGL